jgi:hypothetical protein
VSKYTVEYGYPRNALREPECIFTLKPDSPHQAALEKLAQEGTLIGSPFTGTDDRGFGATGTVAYVQNEGYTWRVWLLMQESEPLRLSLQRRPELILGGVPLDAGKAVA